MVSLPIKILTVDKIYKSFVEEYFEPIKEDDILITFKDYPITDFIVNNLNKEIDAGLIEKWLIFDVWIPEKWEKKVRLEFPKPKKRKLEAPKYPKRKKRKTLS